MKNLDTVWTSQAADGQTLKEYPRPGMVRGRWINLNGMWDYLITDSRILPWQFYENEYFPFDGQILVPFSPEAPLSQVNRQLLPDETLWYSRVIQLPEGSFDPTCQRLLLHFGAVDQICSVYINGKFVTYHKGGYLPFSADITDFVGENLVISILISVRDFSDTSYHARGKQQLERGGMFYTAQSGIWQTVWMEIVPEDYIRDLRITPDFDNGHVKIRMRTECPDNRYGTGNASYDVQPDSDKTSSDSCEDAKGSVHASALCRIYPPVYLDADGVTDELCQQPITEAFLKPGKEISIPVPANTRNTGPRRSPGCIPFPLNMGKTGFLPILPLGNATFRWQRTDIPAFS